MIDITIVNERLTTLFDFEPTHIESAATLVNDSVNEVEDMLINDAYATDSRVINLATALAARKIAMLPSQSDNIVSFTAADIKIQCDSSMENYNKIVDSYMATSRSLVKDGGFLFVGV